ncbi:MAG: BrnA antitoxin family protein [Methylobacter sp.]|nr:BrnA antitoxin family protein [Methylobacter sp.]
MNSKKPNPELIDDENPEWTAAMFSEAKTAAELFPHLIKPESSQKVTTTIEYDTDIVSAFRAAGSNWQVRMNEALREWLREHAL